MERIVRKSGMLGHSIVVSSLSRLPPLCHLIHLFLSDSAVAGVGRPRRLCPPASRPSRR